MKLKLLVCFLLLAVASAFAADATGNWSGSFSVGGGQGNSAYVVLKQSGTTITGTGGPDASQQFPIQHGKIVDNKITGEVQDPDGVVYKLNLVLNGDKISGNMTVTPPGGSPQQATLELARVK